MGAFISQPDRLRSLEIPADNLAVRLPLLLSFLVIPFTLDSD